MADQPSGGSSPADPYKKMQRLGKQSEERQGDAFSGGVAVLPTSGLSVAGALGFLKNSAAYAPHIILAASMSFASVGTSDCHCLAAQELKGCGFGKAHSAV